jgi:competence protein ComEA
VKHLIDSVPLRRALAAVALAAGLAIAAVVLHPPPPPPAVRLDTSAIDAGVPRRDPSGSLRRRGAGAPAGASAGAAVVYVAGAVARPGVYTVAASARVVDALARAGGANGDADLLRVNLAAHVSDGEEIAVLRRGEAAPTARRTAAPRGTAHRKKRRVIAAADDSALDLNSASADQLAELPGLGPELAERIVEFRELNGPFGSVDELADVSGMTPGRLDRLTDRLTVR